MNRIDGAVRCMREAFGDIPETMIVLGSGLGILSEILGEPKVLNYRDIPGFPVSTAPGHASRFVCGVLEGHRVLMMQGRFHYYEGYTMEDVVLPVRAARKLGCRRLVVTNAAGGVNRTFKPGDLMLITDHINLTGRNPLIGPNDEKTGPRFPDMTHAYSRPLRKLMHTAAADSDQILREGVYAWLTGPAYETPSEIRMLGILGADAVGMSTVPEVLAAVHGGMEVVGVSCITNMAAGILDQPITTEEVMEVGSQARDRFGALIRGFVSQLED